MLDCFMKEQAFCVFDMGSFLETKSIEGRDCEERKEKKSNNYSYKSNPKNVHTAIIGVCTFSGMSIGLATCYGTRITRLVSENFRPWSSLMSEQESMMLESTDYY